MRPETHRRGKGPLWLGLLVAVVALGLIGPWLYGQLKPAGEGDAPTAAASADAEAPAERAAAGTDAERRDSDQAAQRDPGRSDTILTCTSVDGQVFYTNATRCEDADLDNRVNVMATPRLPASKPDRCLGAQPDGAPVQTFLPVCQEPFNEALKLERFLLELENPGASPAARRYCAHITAGVQSGCMATSDQFCFLHLCQALRERGGP